MNSSTGIMRRASIGLLFLAAGLPISAACKDKPAETPLNTTGSGSTAMGQLPPCGSVPPGYPCANGPTSPSYYPPASTGGPFIPPTGSTATAPPASTGPDLGQLLGSLGSSLGLGTLAGNVSEAGLEAQRMVYAKDMQPDGAIFKKVLSEGAHDSIMVPMTAGKCYTILGFSPPGIVRVLDLDLMAPPFYTVPFMQAKAVNNRPVIAGGAQATCPIFPFPVSYKLDIHAKSGSGEVVVQVYSRIKH